MTIIMIIIVTVQFYVDVLRLTTEILLVKRPNLVLGSHTEIGK